MNNLLLSGKQSYTYDPADRKLSAISCTGANSVLFIELHTTAVDPDILVFSNL